MRGNASDAIRGLMWANLLAGFILYVTYYRHLEGALAFIRNAAPSIIFICGAILIFSHDKSTIRRRQIHDEDRETITLTYWDALVNDVLAFLTAAAILAFPGLLEAHGLDFIDLLQAILAFVAIIYIRNYYFNKIGR
ncbi:MAG: hypothetical protein PHI63_00340 [Patescibacteria group bacterium]|nr:hypothetical protein [Patescibacteria group bacterium]